jgi:hypothetical protein
MGRKTKEELRDLHWIGQLELWLADPELGQTARSRFMQTLSAMIERQERRKEKRAEAAAARRAERAQATMPPRPAGQGDNGRLIRG